MGKSQKDMCPFSYWRARERNSESTGVVNFIKVRRQKHICIGESQKDMCPFSYWRAREANSESTDVVNFIKVWRYFCIYSEGKVVFCGIRMSTFYN